MTHLSTTLREKELQALLLFAGKNHHREYINSVFIEFGPDPVAYATDGHRLLVIKLRLAGTDERRRVGIPRYAMENLKKHSVAISTEDEPNALIRLSSADLGPRATVEAAPVERCPDWREVFEHLPEPGHDDYGKAAHFNARYLLDASKAKALLCSTLPTKKRPAMKDALIYQNGSKPALIDFGVDFATGLVMPLYIKKPASQLPEWAKAR